MKLTFSDSPNIDELNFKRLLLLANELIFVERPSIHLAENYGTLGMHSNLDSLAKEFEGTPIKLIVDEPPNSSFNSDFYKKYFERDLLNPEFINVIFEGIKNYWIYDSHFDKPHKDTSEEFRDLRAWLLANQNEIKKLDIANIPQPETIYRIKNRDEAYFIFKIIAAEESLRVTSVTHICNKYDSNPISINPYLNKLISLRFTSETYNGRPNKSRQLGLKLMDCIIPDESLKQIPFQEIVDFRIRAKDYFENWTIEINKLEAILFKDNISITDQDAIFLLDSDINPRLKELKNEIQKIRDDKFKDVIKTLKNTALSFIALGTLSSLSMTGAIASFIGANLRTPKFTDDIIDAEFKLKERKLSNGLTYLLKLQELIDRQTL
jgi:hypothetical protein